MSIYYKDEEVIIEKCKHCGKEYKSIMRFDIGICGDCKIKEMENKHINDIPHID